MKYQLIDMTDESVLAKGNCERIGIDGHFKHSTGDGRVFETDVAMTNHTEAFVQIKNALISEEYGVIKSLDEVAAVGHRIVQGGSLFSESVIVNEDVIKGIESLIPLAPLHNAAHVQGIRACLEVFGDKVPEVVVFDTAFHSTMPEKAFIYPVPYEYYEKYAVRRYGFHGTSHRYVSHRCAELMGKDLKDIKMITCHLGNGSSITAIKDGKVIDTSMGLTPLDGFIMGSRCGAIDPSVVTYLQEKDDLTAKQTTNMLNKQSGFLGISGVSSDMRDVEIAAEEGNERAQLALDIFYYQVPKLIASYIVALQGLDALVFTAGIGENGCNVREGICKELEFMGIKMDYEKNNGIRGKEVRLDAEDSKAAIFMIPTNEELMIARETKAIIEAGK